MEHAGYVPEYVLRSSTRVQSTGKSTYVPVIGIDSLPIFWFYRVPTSTSYYVCTKIKWRYRSGVKSNSAQVNCMICINYALLRREFALDHFQQSPHTCPAIVQATVLFLLLSVESAFSNDCSPEVKIYSYAASGK